MTGPLPSASTPMTGAGGLPNRVWYAFFSQLRNGTSDPVARAQIAEILQRLDALENEADADGLIMGLDSVQVYGTLADGLVSVTLKGDVDKPGNTYVYATGPDGVKGWYLLGDAFDTATLAKVVDPDTGVVAFDLAELADTSVGAALVKITRDDYGRVEGTEAATTDDLPEGATNLYFTDERADARIEVAKADPDGIASLVDGKLDAGQLPALAITETFVVADEAAMLALDCQQGDVAVRTDLSKSFILTAEPASTLANWQELLVPTGGVTSFNGRTGSVVPATGDYTPAQVGAEPAVTAGTSAQYWRGDKTWQTLNKAAVGLGNADNTSDTDKPVSSPQQAALNAKQDAGFLTGTATSIRVHNGNGDASGGALRINGTPTLSYHINDVRVFGVNGNGHFFPDPDNTKSLGLSTFRWSVVYAATGTINTSDAREKTPVVELTPNELAAAIDLSRAIGTYQWLSSIAEKGVEVARHHAGLTVQRSIEIMQSHGLDPFRYGFICYDEWAAEPAVIDPETGDEIEPAREAGNRYSFRHDELLLFLARGFAARLDAAGL